MDPLSVSFPAVSPARVQPDPSAELLQNRISALYRLSQTNPHVFASPAGPFTYQRRHIWLPRFVFFGPHASDHSWRLSFIAGLNHRDLRATHALLGLIETLASNAENGHGLNLTFFPLVDAAGLALATADRHLAQAPWDRSAEPEIALLARDIRTRGYHGFVRVDSAPAGEDVVTLGLRTPVHFRGDGPDVELISSDLFEDFDVRFERILNHAESGGTPLDLADDLGVQPFELVLRLPAAWPHDLYSAAVNHILIRFIHRYRSFQAYGGDL